MKTSHGPIHLAAAFDANYLQPFYALLASVASHHPNGSVEWHTIATGVGANTLNKIAAYVNSKGFKINFYSIDDPRLVQFITMSTWTTAVYYRLYFPMLVPSNVKRLLYLDTDTVVVSSLKDLFESDLEHYPVGAVYDNYVRYQPLIGIHREGEYFNSGVLLIDINEWRKQTISERTMSYLLQYPDRIRYVDQCGLNAILYRNWKQLDDRFNVMYSKVPEGMSRAQREEFLSGKVVIHFTIERPWHFLCKNRFRYLFSTYLKRSGMNGGTVISDFDLKKIPAWIRLRSTEFYHDHRWLHSMWRSLKKIHQA